jgi:hypothetical protein
MQSGLGKELSFFQGLHILCFLYQATITKTNLYDLV